MEMNLENGFFFLFVLRWRKCEISILLPSAWMYVSQSLSYSFHFHSRFCPNFGSHSSTFRQDNTVNKWSHKKWHREREWMKCIIHIFTRIVLQIIEERTTKEACEIYLWVEIHLEFIKEKTMKWGTFYCRFNYAAKSKSRANISTQNWNEQSNNRTFNKKWTEIFIISNFCWMALANFPSKARNCTIFMKMNICVELFKKKKQCSMHALMLICHDANDEMCKSVWL